MRARPRQGENVRVTEEPGPNVAGPSTAEVKQQILKSVEEEPEPLGEQALPRMQREHARHYMELLQSPP